MAASIFMTFQLRVRRQEEHPEMLITVHNYRERRGKWINIASPRKWLHAHSFVLTPLRNKSMADKIDRQYAMHSHAYHFHNYLR